MIRWRYCLFLAMLLVPVITGAKSSNDDDEDERNNENDEEEEEEEDDEDEAPPEREKSFPRPSGRRAPNVMPSVLPTETTHTVPRTPLECYVCAYKSETMLKSCLDPNRYRVHTMYCHSVDDKCFTSIIAKDNSYEAVMRGCRSACYASAETTCCESNRCNNQALAIPVQHPTPRAREDSGSGDTSSTEQTKASVPSVLFFVTILLVLQTVVKVAF